MAATSVTIGFAASAGKKRVKYYTNMRKKFKYGDISKDIWCGDIVTTCQFIGNLKDGKMLWRDLESNCFRLVHWEDYAGKIYMNGWKCEEKLENLI